MIRQAGGVGVDQPGEEKALVTPYSTLKGLQESWRVMFYEGMERREKMASNCVRAGLV